MNYVSMTNLEQPKKNNKESTTFSQHCKQSSKSNLKQNTQNNLKETSIDD